MKKKEEEKKGKGEGSERKKERGRRQWEGGERGAKDGHGGVYDPGGAWKGRIVIAVSMLGLKIPWGICK